MADPWKARGRRAARALLREEGLALHSLRAVAKAAKERLVLASVMVGGDDRRHVAEQVAGIIRQESQRLVVEMTTAVAAVRLSAKTTSLELLRAEWDAVRHEVRRSGSPDPGALGVLPHSAPTDELAAQRTAQSFTAAWSSVTLAAAWQWAEGTSPSVANDVAAIDMDGRIRRIAATEPAQATADARDEGAGWLAEQYGEERWFPAVLKRWDAANDRKVCRVCSDLDGTTELLGMSFPGGEAPGYVHPFCRCVEHLIWLPARIRGETTPGRQVDDDNPRPVKAA